MKTLYTTIFLFITLLSYGQNDVYLKKLGAYKENLSSKETREIIASLDLTVRDSMYTNALKSEQYARVALQLAERIEDAELEIDAMLNLGKAMIYLNDLDSARVFAKNSLQYAKKVKSHLKTLQSHQLLGNVAFYEANYDAAIKEYYASIRIAEKKDPIDAINSYVNVGLVFKNTGNTAKARKYTLKSYDLGVEHKDTSVILTALNILGILEKNEGNISKALEYYEEGVELGRKTNEPKRLAELLNNLANIYFKQKNYDKGFELFNESMELSKHDGTHSQVAIGYHTLAMNCHAVGRAKEAQEAGDKALKHSLLSGNYELIISSYSLLAELAYSKGKDKDAYELLKKAEKYGDSLRLDEIQNAVIEAEDIYLSEKEAYADSITKAQSDLILANEKKVNDQKVKFRERLLWISGLMLILVLIGVYYLSRKNKQVKAKNIIVEKQKKEIEIQHQEITDSINYAQRIQDAIISNKVQWDALSENYNVFFQPKDVVSGDFYWAHNNKEKNIAIWAVADCTGHGVPGAFMSMLGIGYLNEIVIEGGKTNPGEILDLLRDRIIAALKNDHSESKDGMDIGLCVWDKTTNELSFAGANNGLWLMRDKSNIIETNYKSVVEVEGSTLALAEIGPDKMPIGKMFSVPPPFETKKLQLLDGDTIVLFTDGYADQFGGPDNKKFKYRPLKRLLLELDAQSMEQQQEALSKTFQAWKGEVEQTDDVCIASVKVRLI